MPDFRALRPLLAAYHARPTGDDEADARCTAELLAQLTDANAAAFVRFLSADDRASAFGRAALARWLATDPETAANWILGRPDIADAEALLVARAFIANAAAGGEICDRLPDTAAAQRFLRFVASESLAAGDVVTAAAFSDRLADPAERADLQETIAYDWMTRDPAAALRWIEGAAEPESRFRLYAVAAKAFAASDPELACDWLRAAITSQPELDAALESVREIASVK